MKGNSLTTVFLITMFLYLVAPGVTAVAQEGYPLGVHRLPDQTVIYGDMSGDDDCYQCYLITMKKGQLLYADIDARDMGSCLDSILEIRSYPDLDILLTNDDALNTLDSQLVFKAPRLGYYLICVRDFNDCEPCPKPGALYNSYGPNAEYSSCFGHYLYETFIVSPKKSSTTSCNKMFSDLMFLTSQCWYFLNYEIRNVKKEFKVEFPPPVDSDFVR